MISVVARVHVAVGVIINNRQEVLIAKRAEDLHQGGLWEFPGGKVEQNETVEEALSRELNEELGITVETARPFIKVIHDYPDKSVLLDIWLIEKFTGQPEGRQDQPLQWVAISDLKHYAFPQANGDIVRALEARYKIFPDEIVITGAYDNLDDYVAKLQYALNAGVKWVHLRAHFCRYDDYLTLFELTNIFCKQHSAQLTVNTSLDWFHQLRATGLHFTTERLLETIKRPVHKSVLFGASCHNPAEIQHAENIGVDYITLGPVFNTATHPVQEPIRPELFADWVKQARLPVFALGGVTPALKPIMQDAGAYGVAGISHYWRS